MHCRLAIYLQAMLCLIFSANSLFAGNFMNPANPASPISPLNPLSPLHPSKRSSSSSSTNQGDQNSYGPDGLTPLQTTIEKYDLTDADKRINNMSAVGMGTVIAGAAVASIFGGLRNHFCNRSLLEFNRVVASGLGLSTIGLAILAKYVFEESRERRPLNFKKFKESKDFWMVKQELGEVEFEELFTDLERGVHPDRLFNHYVRPYERGSYLKFVSETETELEREVPITLFTRRTRRVHMNPIVTELVLLKALSEKTKDPEKKRQLQEAIETRRNEFRTAIARHQ